MSGWHGCIILANTWSHKVIWNEYTYISYSYTFLARPALANLFINGFREKTLFLRFHSSLFLTYYIDFCDLQFKPSTFIDVLHFVYQTRKQHIFSLDNWMRGRFLKRRRGFTRKSVLENNYPQKSDGFFTFFLRRCWLLSSYCGGSYFFFIVYVQDAAR